MTDAKAGALPSANGAVVTVSPLAQPVPQGTSAAPQAAPVPSSSPTASTFFPILPPNAPPNAMPELMPLASNHSLTEDHGALTRAIIVIHDYSRDASTALATMMTLAGQDNGKTLIIAPQFLLESDIARFADRLPDGGKSFMRWAPSGWVFGGDSLPVGQSKGISAFSALDLLLVYLSDGGLYPSLHQVVIVGNGNGADFVQRYAASGRAPDIMEKQNIGVRYLVTNASSYTYITSMRLKDSPQKNVTPPDTSACKIFNYWPYGLDGLTGYAASIGANQIKERYITRPITTLAGAEAGQADPAPDTSCAAALQGNDRASRANLFGLYLGTIYGPDAHKLQSFGIVPKAGYDPASVWGSKCGVSVLFGDGTCPSF